MIGSFEDSSPSSLCLPLSLAALFLGTPSFSSSPAVSPLLCRVPHHLSAKLASIKGRPDMNFGRVGVKRKQNGHDGDFQNPESRLSFNSDSQARRDRYFGSEIVEYRYIGPGSDCSWPVKHQHGEIIRNIHLRVRRDAVELPQKLYCFKNFHVKSFIKKDDFLYEGDFHHICFGRTLVKISPSYIKNPLSINKT